MPLLLFIGETTALTFVVTTAEARLVRIVEEAKLLVAHDAAVVCAHELEQAQLNRCARAK